MTAVGFSTDCSLSDTAGATAVAAPGLRARVRGWLAARARARLQPAQRLLLQRYALPAPAEVLTLDGGRGSSAGRCLRLRATRDTSVDVVVSFGALADAGDVEQALAEIARVLRPGGRLLFVEPVAAAARTPMRRLQGALHRLWPLLSGTAAPPRDLWNDLKRAPFAQLSYDAVDVRGFGGMPVPHLIGAATAGAARPAAPARTAPRLRLPRRGPAYTFLA